MLGKGDFTDEALLDNLKSFMVAVHEKKPLSFKGKLLKNVWLRSSMGRLVRLHLPYVDPANMKFMQEHS